METFNFVLYIFMEIVIISLVSFIAALLTFFSGFGLGTLLTPVMLLYFPVEVAIGLTGIVHFSNNIFKLFMVGNYVDKRVLLRFGLPAVLAAFAGSYLLFYLNNDSTVYSYSFMGTYREVTLVKFLISLLLLLFALIDLIPFFGRLKFEDKSLPIGGFLSGFFGGLSGNQGALRTAFLIKAGLEKKVFIGTTVVISTLVDFTRLGVYTNRLFHLDLTAYYTLAFFAIVSGIMGSFLGNKLLKKITLTTVRIIVAVLILFLAVGLLLGLL